MTLVGNTISDFCHVDGTGLLAALTASVMSVPLVRHKLLGQDEQHMGGAINKI
jgi:hypothetical protein